MSHNDLKLRSNGQDRWVSLVMAVEYCSTFISSGCIWSVNTEELSVRTTSVQHQSEGHGVTASSLDVKVMFTCVYYLEPYPGVQQNH